MTLAEAPLGTPLRIVRRDPGGGRGSVLDGLGLFQGDEVTILAAAPFHGPVLVEVRSTGARIAIGRGMASSVDVEPETCR
jgi:Fe2+ transport system protein FeoA